MVHRFGTGHLHGSRTGCGVLNLHPNPCRLDRAKVHGIRAGFAVPRCTISVHLGQHSIGRDHSDNSSSVNLRPPQHTTYVQRLGISLPSRKYLRRISR